MTTCWSGASASSAHRQPSTAAPISRHRAHCIARSPTAAAADRRVDARPAPRQARLSFPQDYPYAPPKMRFTCRMWHPNVYADGRMCISILHPPGSDPFNTLELPEERWNPAQSVRYASRGARCDGGRTATRADASAQDDPALGRVAAERAEPELAGKRRRKRHVPGPTRHLRRQGPRHCRAVAPGRSSRGHCRADDGRGVHRAAHATAGPHRNGLPQVSGDGVASTRA